MVVLFVASLVMAHPPSSDEALALCKSALAAKEGVDIGEMNVSSSRVTHGRRTIQGQLTAFSQMGPAPAGAARTHHLGRIEFTFRCELSGRRVREARLNPLNP